MKKLLKITSLIWLVTIGLFFFNSCNKNEDLVTSDAKEGGLVTPLITSFPYKLGNTPQVDLTVAIPKGPGIVSIEIMNSFKRITDGAVTNEVTMKTIAIGSSNANSADTVSFSFTYADLKKDLLLAGAPLPDESLLDIGSEWTLKYVSVMEDGRKVLNNAKTKIGVANMYAGKYHAVGTFNHPTAGPRPIDEDKDLAALSAYQVSSTLGDLGGDYPIIITVNPADNTVICTKMDPDPYDILMTAGQTSRYEPSTGKFYLYYYYVGTNGLPRIIDEVLTPITK